MIVRMGSLSYNFDCDVNFSGTIVTTEKPMEFDGYTAILDIPNKSEPELSDWKVGELAFSPILGGWCTIEAIEDDDDDDDDEVVSKVILLESIVNGETTYVSVSGKREEHKNQIIQAWPESMIPAYFLALYPKPEIKLTRYLVTYKDGSERIYKKLPPAPKGTVRKTIKLVEESEK